MPDRDRLQQFERATEVPLLALALLMVPLLLAPYVVELSPEADSALRGIEWIIWGVFAADLAARTYLAPRRVSYLVTHWYDVLIVVMPFLRPLRTFSIWRIALRAPYLVRSARTASALLRRRGVNGALSAAGIALVVSTLIVFYAERGAAGPIDSIDTATWWALATITTVGYGDAYPVTHLGRGVATFLMLVGIGLFGVLTAQVAAFFIEQRDEDTTNELIAEIRALRDEVATRDSERGV